jgi:tRNA(Ile)-lysidine synthase
MLAGVRRLGVAVSGGADSVALLLVMQRLAQPLNLDLAVVHLNHKLRGVESDADATAVRELATRFGIRCFLREVDVRAGGGNLEQSGRDARRRLFRDLIEERTVDRIATAHTRSDQAETVLYRLLRGSGTSGMCGVLPVTLDGIIRPFFDVVRDEVISFLRHTGETWRDDSSNLNNTFTRNRIRHELLPIITKDYSLAAVEILAGTADVARDEEAYWSKHVAGLAQTVFARRAGALIAETAVLLAHGPAVARRLVRYALSQVKGDLRSIDILHVERILSICATAEGSGRVQVPGVDVMRSFSWVRFARFRTESRQERDYSFELDLRAGVQRISLPRQECQVVLEIQRLPRGGESYNQGDDRLDFERLTPPVQLRNWHPGDELHVPGRGPQKLKSLFQEARVPLWERQGWPLLTAAGRVVWARRFGADARFCAGERSGTCLYVRETGVFA